MILNSFWNILLALVLVHLLYGSLLAILFTLHEDRHCPQYGSSSCIGRSDTARYCHLWVQHDNLKGACAFPAIRSRKHAIVMFVSFLNFIKNKNESFARFTCMDSDSRSQLKHLFSPGIPKERLADSALYDKVFRYGH